MKLNNYIWFSKYLTDNASHEKCVPVWILVNLIKSDPSHHPQQISPILIFYLFFYTAFYVFISDWVWANFNRSI